MGRLLLMKGLVYIILSMVLSVVATNAESDESCKFSSSLSLAPRPHSVSLLEFGAVGDGKTLNTLAFQNAMYYVKSFSDKGGAQVFVPSGRWLTGSFNLTSHLTLFLDRDAIILGSQDSSQWPLVEPLPSYGRGVDLPGGRHRSLINGRLIKDVVITGDNGTIDGQGSVWWEWLQSLSLNYSRPHLLELETCKNVLISNLTFVNPPSWTIHPVYCSNVQMQNVTIRVSSDSSDTDGIVPDSCSSVCIEDCYIQVGNDAISLKSGWDEYGISYKKPISDVYINTVQLLASAGSALAFGSEMSGGISDVRASDIHIYNSLTGIKFKTNTGRGGYIEHVVISDVQMENVALALGASGHFGQHPDDHYDPHAYPRVNSITLKNVIGRNVTTAGNLIGIQEAPFTGICLSNILLSVNSDPSSSWACSAVEGFSQSVFPEPCPDLKNSSDSSACYSLLNSVDVQAQVL